MPKTHRQRLKYGVWLRQRQSEGFVKLKHANPKKIREPIQAFTD